MGRHNRYPNPVQNNVVGGIDISQIRDQKLDVEFQEIPGSNDTTAGFTADIPGKRVFFTKGGLDHVMRLARDLFVASVNSPQEVTPELCVQTSFDFWDRAGKEKERLMKAREDQKRSGLIVPESNGKTL